MSQVTKSGIPMSQVCNCQTKRRVRGVPATEPKYLRRGPKALHHVREVGVLRHYDDALGFCGCEDRRVLSLSQSNIADGHGRNVERRFQPGAQWRVTSVRRARPSRRGLHSRSAGAGEPQTSRNVIEFEIGEFRDDLVGRKPRSEQVQNIADANAHAAHAGPASALKWMNRDSLSERFHIDLLEPFLSQFSISTATMEPAL